VLVESFLGHAAQRAIATRPRLAVAVQRLLRLVIGHVVIPRHAASSLSRASSKYSPTTASCSPASSTRTILRRSSSPPGRPARYHPRCLRAVLTPRASP